MGATQKKPDMLSPFRKRIAAEVECEAGDWSSNDGSYTDSFTKTLMLVHHLTGVPRNGVLPVTISQSVTPSEYWSTRP